MQLSNPAERRRYPRALPLSTKPVEIQLMGTRFLDVVEAEDISERGLAIRVSHEFAGCNLESAVDLIITLPGRPSFKARGIIRHAAAGSDRTLFGVELTQISSTNQAAIGRYVDYLVALGRRAR